MRFQFNNFLLIAGLVMVVGFSSGRYWQSRNSLVYFLVQFVVFSLLTGLLLAGGIVPYRLNPAADSELGRLFVAALEVFWWLTGAWLAIGFLRAFVVLGRRPRVSKLVQDLLAALIYLSAMFAIVAYVFDLPLKGLLATSGALAIIIGLALQSSLGDVFSGIVLNLEGPYRVGDWVILDGAVQGTVIETNWRATHILTASQDVAIVPNSIIAKSKLVNCSSPSKVHGSSVRVKLTPSLTPAAGCELLKEVLLGSTKILRLPAPTVAIKDASAEMIDFELSYSVGDVGMVDAARNEIFDRVYHATAAAGARFAPRLAGAVDNAPTEAAHTDVADRLLAGISLFSALTATEKSALAATMRRTEYQPAEVVVNSGTVLQSLHILSEGVLVGSQEDNGIIVERIRLTAGTYFGEGGLLTGQPLLGEITALTKVVIYEIAKESLLPLLKARPGMAEELSEALAKRRLDHITALNNPHDIHQRDQGLAGQIATTIKHLFSLH
jgi:small-conductance mechanosensitive channel/CRP-like cAMP-binding protein